MGKNNIPLHKVDTIKDLRMMLDNSVNKFGQKAAFLRKTPASTEYVPVSYAQFRDDVNAFGEALYSIGCQGSRIAVIGENRYEWSVSYLSVINGLGVIVPLDKELPVNEIVMSLNRAAVTTIIFSDKLTDKMLEAVTQVPTLKHLITMSENAEIDKPQDSDVDIQSFWTLLSKGHELINDGKDEYKRLPIDVEGMSVLLFTSGTTDISKAVMLSQSNICENLMAMCAMTYIDEHDVFLSILPIHHTYECTCGYLCPLYRGSTIAYCEGLRHIVKNLAEAKVTMILGVPLVFESMHKKVWDHIKKQGIEGKVRFGIKLSNLLRKFGIDITHKLFKQIHDSFGGHLRLLISGAAAIDPIVSKDFNAFGILMIQGYGLTECAPIAALNRNCFFKDSAAGLPMPGTELKIEDASNDGIGEIIIKGPNVMLGYYEDEAATKQAIDTQGFFHTGDLGFVDKEGFVHITGRKKNVIVTKNGKNVFPEEIEYLLLKSPYIAEVVVYGEEENGETIVKANIFPDYDAIKEDAEKGNISSDNPQAVIQNEVKAVNKQLVSYKAVKGFHLREEEFIKTSTKKIKRYVESNQS